MCTDHDHDMLLLSVEILIALLWFHEFEREKLQLNVTVDSACPFRSEREGRTAYYTLKCTFSWL